MISRRAFRYETIPEVPKVEIGRASTVVTNLRFQRRLTLPYLGLAQVLVREEEALVITTVSEEYRIGLRRQIRKESLLKEQEDAKSFHDLESHIPEYPSAKIVNRARKVLAKKLEAVFAGVRKA